MLAHPSFSSRGVISLQRIQITDIRLPGRAKANPQT